MTLHQGAEYLRKIGAISPELVNDEDRMALTLGLIGELSALMKPLTLEEMKTFLQNAFANDFLNPPKSVSCLYSFYVRVDSRGQI